MSAPPATALDRLRDRRALLLGEFHAIEARIEEIDATIAMLEIEADRAEQPAAAPAPKAARGEVEKAVRDEMKATDISYSTEELSESIGHNRESVAAVLRRLVKSGEVEREGERYRIARPVQDAAE